MMKLKIKKGDEVKVLTGKDKGRSGMVLEVNAARQRIRVKGVHVQTLFDKKEGIQKREGFIHYSNVSLERPRSTKAKAPTGKAKKSKSLFSS